MQKVLFYSAPQPGMPTPQTATSPPATGKVTGFLALPGGPNRHRAIILIHEWWGLNNWVKKQAANLAAHGYVALAVDLYQGKVTADPTEARKLKCGLREDRAVRDLQGAFAYLAGRLDVDSKHIGALGWSMGGGLALQLAIREPGLAACVVNYGPLPTNLEDIKKINAQVLGIFGTLDRGISPAKVRAFESCMNTLKKAVKIEIYDGAGHAFENPASKDAYRPEATADAWLRTLKFFDKAMGSKYSIS